MDSICAKLIKRTESTWQDVESSRDVLSCILSKVPVMDLVLHRAVSSHWRSVIRCPKFAEKQLAVAKEDPVFLLYPFVGEVTDVFLVDANGSIVEEINILGLADTAFLSMNCSCNGLVCFTNYPWEPSSDRREVNLMDLEIRICNPITRQVHLLPPGTPSKDEPDIGVAFGLNDSEYKVFRIYRSEPKSQDMPPLCEVYTLQLGTWRQMGSVPKWPMNSKSVFIDGKLYWFLPSEDDQKIAGSMLMVDMEENFKIMALPDEVTAHAFLLDLDGHLCLVAIYDDDLIMNIWLLKYNDAGNYYWERKTSDEIPYSVMETTDAAAGLKNKIFLITTEHYYIYDIESRTWNDLPFITEFDRHCPTVFTYTGSLLPCNGVWGPGY